MREVIIGILMIGFIIGCWVAIYEAGGFKDTVFNFLTGFIIGVGLACAVVILAVAIVLVAAGVVELIR